MDKNHSRNTVSYMYIKSLRNEAFESLEALTMYYTMGASVSSLHRVTPIVLQTTM